ncbi:hypothetical protein [Grimontia celer]|nr:hypothetical protein [Grimontia celer]
MFTYSKGKQGAFPALSSKHVSRDGTSCLRLNGQLPKEYNTQI